MAQLMPTGSMCQCVEKSCACRGECQLPPTRWIKCATFEALCSRCAEYALGSYPGAREAAEPLYERWDRFSRNHPFLARALRRGTFPIPVGSSASEALRLPFDHLGQFARLATVPLVITAASQVIGGLLVALSAHSAFNFFWLAIFTVVAVPFSAGWTRFAVLGSAGVSNRSWFSFGHRELKYLIYSAGLALAIFGPAALCVYISYALGWSVWLLILAAVLGATEIVAGFRFMFILPAIALDSFRGVKTAWKQTRSTVLRTLAIIIISGLPINCGASIVRRVGNSVRQPSGFLVLGVVDLLLTFLSLAVEIGAIAICYRFRVNSQTAALHPSADATLADADL